jgi:hypothetical protein
MKLFTLDELITDLKHIAEQGWLLNSFGTNDGAAGNMLESLLEVPTNNLPVMNCGEWELKTHQKSSSALITLFHKEPSPTAIKFVPCILVPDYGWAAGGKYANSERSFRQTIHCGAYSDRGFTVNIDRKLRKIAIAFDVNKVALVHAAWKSVVKQDLNPQPYWGFDDLAATARSKLVNCFYIQPEVKFENKVKYFWYKKITKLSNFIFDNFINGIENGNIRIDFDARTGHNHGTKFRVCSSYFETLYERVEEIV